MSAMGLKVAVVRYILGNSSLVMLPIGATRGPAIHLKLSLVEQQVFDITQIKNNDKIPRSLYIGREALRKLYVGKEANYLVDESHDDFFYGDISVDPPQKPSDFASHFVIANGLGKLTKSIKLTEFPERLEACENDQRPVTDLQLTIKELTPSLMKDVTTPDNNLYKGVIEQVTGVLTFRTSSLVDDNIVVFNCVLDGVEEKRAQSISILEYMELNSLHYDVRIKITRIEEDKIYASVTYMDGADLAENLIAAGFCDRK